MPERYFDFFGKPARITVDADDLPERCEVYDVGEGGFVVRDDLTLDVTSSSGSHLISAEQFEKLLARQGAKVQR